MVYILWYFCPTLFFSKMIQTHWKFPLFHLSSFLPPFAPPPKKKYSPLCNWVFHSDRCLWVREKYNVGQTVRQGATSCWWWWWWWYWWWISGVSMIMYTLFCFSINLLWFIFYFFILCFPITIAGSNIFYQINEF